MSGTEHNSIFHNGIKILKELRREIRVKSLLDIRDMTSENLIEFEKQLRLPNVHFSKRKFLFGVHRELMGRSLKWDYDSDSWLKN